MKVSVLARVNIWSGSKGHGVGFDVKQGGKVFPAFLFWIRRRKELLPKSRFSGCHFLHVMCVWDVQGCHRQAVRLG